MDNKIKLKPNIIKPYKNINKISNTSSSSLHNFMKVYFDHKITPSVYESIVKTL
jgi:hypothetical protein